MKHPSQVDVASLAGVSRATVSYVINSHTDGRIPISESTRQRVLDAVEQLGYVPDARAQSLRSGDTKTIGLIIPEIRNPYYWEHAEGIAQEARNSNYHLLLSDTECNREYAEDIFKDLSRKRIDGMILMHSFIDQSEEAMKILKTLLRRRLPIVEISDHHLSRRVDFVISDYSDATKQVMSYLLSLNHQRIGMIYGVASSFRAEDRLQPYQESLKAAGLPVDEELIVKCGPEIEDGYQAALKILNLPVRPTALIAINDLLAIGVMRAAKDLGLNIPGDLSVVGFDDIHISNYLIPRLTTVARDAITVGKEAVKLLLARINNPDMPRKILNIPPRLVIRESTGPAPDNAGSPGGRSNE